MLQLKSFPTKTTQFIGPLLVFILALLAFIFDQQISDLLIYDRNTIIAGEYWRLLTGHFFHSNGNHFGPYMAIIIMLKVISLYFLSVL